MKRNERETLADLAQRNPFSPIENVPFGKDFPEVEDFTITVKQLGGRKDWTFNPQYLPPTFFDCPDLACTRGGFNLRNAFNEALDSKKTLFEDHQPCRGYERSTKPSRKCFSFFDISIWIKYK